MKKENEYVYLGAHFVWLWAHKIPH